VPVNGNRQGVTAGGIAAPADAALVVQLGADGVFVGSGIIESGPHHREPATGPTRAELGWPGGAPPWLTFGLEEGRKRRDSPGRRASCWA
jgi:hypothetical protein